MPTGGKEFAESSFNQYAPPPRNLVAAKGENRLSSEPLVTAATVGLITPGSSARMSECARLPKQINMHAASSSRTACLKVNTAGITANGPASAAIPHDRRRAPMH